jgi:hypothetical protein
MDYVEKEKVKLSMKSMDTIVSRSILKDNRYNSRILYAGPRDNESIVIYRLVELVRGRYCLEQTVINTHFKSIQTTMAALNTQHFEKYTPPQKLLHQQTYHPDANLLSATSYARQITSRTFFNIAIRDNSSQNRSYWRIASDCYLKYKMKKYLNQRI